MPTDALLVTIAVFVGFAAALAWADRQTNSSQFKSEGPASKR
jgi:hypothetical protein